MYCMSFITCFLPQVYTAGRTATHVRKSTHEECLVSPGWTPGILVQSTEAPVSLLGWVSCPHLHRRLPSPTSHDITQRWTTLLYDTRHCIALHCITLRYITLQYIILHYMTLQYITLHYITLQYITSHYITYIALHYITSRHITSHRITLHYTLRFISFHFILFHYITLHYITSN